MNDSTENVFSTLQNTVTFENIQIVNNPERVSESSKISNNEEINSIDDGSIYSYIASNPPIKWPGFIDMFGDEIKHASDIIESRKKLNIRDDFRILPNREDIFRIFNEIEPEKIKVCIFAQDPYHHLIPATDIPIANGIAFSVSDDCPIPQTLRNIFAEIKSNYPDSIFFNGNLKQWIRQGVFLINMSLTVEMGLPGSHEEIWIPLLKKVVDHISKLNQKTIFALWGKPAKAIGKEIIVNQKNTITAGHPSGANRKNDFLGCGHFNEINRLLVLQSNYPIDWSVYQSI